MGYGGDRMAEALAYRPAEALAVFPIGRSALFELLKAGEIESFRVGRARFIPRQSLLDYMERQLAEERGQEAAGRARPA
jgi:excisionase family DNA binding protein